MNKDINPNADKYDLTNFPEMKYKILSESWLNECLVDINQINDIKETAKKIVKRFNITGLCDVGYIANIIGSNMKMNLEPTTKQNIIKRILFCYSSTIHDIKSAKLFLTEVI